MIYVFKLGAFSDMKEAEQAAVVASQMEKVFNKNPIFTCDCGKDTEIVLEFNPDGKAGLRVSVPKYCCEKKVVPISNFIKQNLHPPLN